MKLLLILGQNFKSATYILKEIRSIIQAYAHIDFQQEQVALASVVNVEASSYRRIGARMLVRSNGLWIGGISGGCLEGDALKRSQKAIFKNQASKVVYDTMDDDSNQIGVGLGCNGKIEVLFTPIDPSDPNNEINLLKKISTAEQASILVKIIDAPEQASLLGRHCLVTPNTPISDFAAIDPTLLAGFIETTQQKKKPRIFHCQNKNQQQLKLLIEYIRPETRLVIIGDNYDIQAMLGIATEMGWETIVVGKQKKIPKSVYQQAKQVLPYEAVEQIKIHDYTAVLLMTHDYHLDQQMLAIFIKKAPSYLGMLGPKKRLLKMQQELQNDQIEKLSFLFSPTGLEIGAESPQEIALSIAAEIVASFRDKPGGSLRNKTGTIHLRE